MKIFFEEKKNITGSNNLHPPWSLQKAESNYPTIFYSVLCGAFSSWLCYNINVNWLSEYI